MTLTEARALVRGALGPQGRVWVEPDGTYTLGLDKRPGRGLLGYGDTLEELFTRSFNPHNQEFKRAAKPTSASNTPEIAAEGSPVDGGSPDARFVEEN